MVDALPNPTFLLSQVRVRAFKRQCGMLTKLNMFKYKYYLNLDLNILSERKLSICDCQLLVQFDGKLDFRKQF